MLAVYHVETHHATPNWIRNSESPKAPKGDLLALRSVGINITMENGPFEDVFPIKNGEIPLLC